jgi:hypothetical protein
MKTIKEVIEDDFMGFVFWCVFLIIFIFELVNLNFIANSIIEAYCYGLIIDFILSIIVAVGLPVGFIRLSYEVWIKK